MYRIKKIPPGLFLLLTAVLLSACGPSPEELAATSAAETAAAATSTPAITPTSAPTLTPKPTLTPTPTPVPEPDSKAMLKWREAGFPDGFFAIPPGMRGVEEGANAFSLIADDGSLLEYTISGSFAFNDDFDDPSQMIYGYSVLLPTAKDRNTFDTLDADTLRAVMSNGFGVSFDSVSVIVGAGNIGDHSAGVTTEYNRQGELWQVGFVSFRVDDIGAWVFIRNEAGVPSPVSIAQVARIYADSIQRPVIPCKLTSVEPDLSAAEPTFNIVAEGFYPNEGRWIGLAGDLLQGAEIIKGATQLQGLEGQSADNDGTITETVAFPLSEQSGQDLDLPPGPNEFKLTIRGYGSGCEIEEIVTWPGE